MSNVYVTIDPFLSPFSFLTLYISVLPVVTLDGIHILLLSTNVREWMVLDRIGEIDMTR